MPVLIDRQEQGRWAGRSEFDSPEVDNEVFVESRRQLEQGEFVQVRILDAMEYDLLGEALE
jgi:ribosomal protein S12 methylthiotransferase